MERKQNRTQLDNFPVWKIWFDDETDYYIIRNQPNAWRARTEAAKLHIERWNLNKVPSSLGYTARVKRIEDYRKRYNRSFEDDMSSV